MRFIALLTCGFALLQSGTTAINRLALQGTLGTNRIGMTLLVDGTATITGGHYFYAKYWKDIPLTCTDRDGVVTLGEPGGGTFTLHFKGNGSEGGKPLDFNNSIGLEGTWTGAGKQFPVSLLFQDTVAMNPNARRYQDVTQESDAAFEARVQSFYRAVLGGDRDAATKQTSFPLRVNTKGAHRMIRNAAQLKSQWDGIFTAGFLAALRDAMPHDLFVRNGQAMLGEGVVWFGAKGAESLNIP